MLFHAVRVYLLTMQVMHAYYCQFPLYLGAVHRYYESRRRLFNDSKLERRDQVLRNAITTRRRGFQKRVRI